MRSVSLDMLRGAYWYSFNDEPIPTVSAYPYPRLTAPSFLLPDESPDSLWHLYAETVFGIEHFSSTSGLEWKRESIIAYAAHTPSIYREGSVYYLLYETERTKRKLRRVPSSIILRSSTDLVSWSDPITILDSEGIPYASYRDGRDRLSYPCLMQCDGRYRLYAGGGISAFTGSRSPAYLLATEARDITGPYEVIGLPVIAPEPDSEYVSISAGSVRVLPCSDGFAAVECSRYYDEDMRRERSAMLLLESPDGFVWKQSGILQLSAESGWASCGITSCDLRYKENEGTWYCYYAASGCRDGRFPLKRESIGLLLGRMR